MAEPVLLSIDYREAKDWDRRARQGDREAAEWFAQLFEGYDNLPCFLCDREVDERPVFTQIVCDYKRGDRVIAAPLCSKCRALGSGQRLNRALKMLQAMHHAGQPKRGRGKSKQLHFALRRR